jgi:DNA-binding GntR family transcriptional regulator
MQLEAEGLIYRRNRRGWFVTPPRLVFWPGRKQNFSQATAQQNRQAETEILSAGIVNADTDISRDLDLQQGAQVYQIIRLRRLEQRPVLYEMMYLSVERLPDLLEHPLDQSLTDLLETHYGEVISHERTRITSATILPGATETLEVLPGRTGVCLHRLRSNADGQPIELDIEYWLSDAIEIRVETHSE